MPDRPRTFIADDDAPAVRIPRSFVADAPAGERTPYTGAADRRPAATEDYLPKPKGMPEQVWSAIKGGFRTTIGAIPSTLETLSDLQRGTLGGDFDALERTRQRAGGMVGAQVSELEKAKQAYDEGRTGDAVSSGLAGAIPLVGPALGQARDVMASGDVAGGLGETAGIAASLVAGRVAPKVAAPLATIGEQMLAKGKAVAPIAMKVAEFVPGISGPVRAARQTAAIMDLVEEMRLARKAGSEPPPVAPPSPNAGGRVVPSQAPTVEQAVSGALSDLQRPVQPARITTPPAPDLPPNYTPRTTVPKEVPKRMAKASVPADVDTAIAEAKAAVAAKEPPKRAYFLRSPEEVAAIQARKAAAAAAPETIAPSDITDPAQMPEAWRSRMGPPELPKPRKPATKVTAAEIDELAQGLVAKGMSARDAIRKISKEREMSAETRTRLMTALGKLAAKGRK